MRVPSESGIGIGAICAIEQGSELILDRSCIDQGMICFSSWSLGFHTGSSGESFMQVFCRLDIAHEQLECAYGHHHRDHR